MKTHEFIKSKDYPRACRLCQSTKNNPIHVTSPSPMPSADELGKKFYAQFHNRLPCMTSGTCDRIVEFFQEQLVWATPPKPGEEWVQTLNRMSFTSHISGSPLYFMKDDDDDETGYAFLEDFITQLLAKQKAQDLEDAAEYWKGILKNQRHQLAEEVEKLKLENNSLEGPLSDRAKDIVAARNQALDAMLKLLNPEDLRK